MTGKIEICGGVLLVTLLLAATARAQTMPACDDSQTLMRVEKLAKFSYENNGDTFQSLRDTKETGNGPTVENYHMYETRTQKIDGVRYCEVTAILGGGETDTLYYRIVHLVDGDKHKFNPDICSPRIFSFLRECADWRGK
jgi:hypothetical protein